MWQGDGDIATPSADILGKPQLMSVVGPKAEGSAHTGCTVRRNMPRWGS
jgi:hypothetical protein